MKIKLLSLIVLAGLLFSPIHAQTGKVGVGVVIGDPTGLSLKINHDAASSYNFAAAWSTGNETELQVHADYVRYNYKLLNLELENGTMPLYYGIGLNAHLSKNSALGIRVPLGINYIFSNAPLDMFFELAPTINVLPSTQFYLNGGIGIRYFF